MRIIFIISLLALGLAAANASADETITEERLFHIERNKNENIVVFDARVQADGNLTKKDPVIVYWLKMAEDGRREGLKWIEKKMAYGFKVDSREGNRVVMKMKADVGRLVTVEPDEEEFRAYIEIDGQRAILERIFIFADESGTLPKVLYLELFGNDPETGEELYEKLEV